MDCFGRLDRPPMVTSRLRIVVVSQCVCGFGASNRYAGCDGDGGDRVGFGLGRSDCH